MPDTEPVASAPAAGSAPVPDAAQNGGVANATTTPPIATPVKMVPETDLNKLRSGLDRQNQELRAQIQQLQEQSKTFQQQAVEARLKDMTPDEKLAFEVEQEQNQLEQERLALQQQQYAAANAQYKYELATYYMKQGVPWVELQGIDDPAEMQDAAFKYFKSPDYLKSHQTSAPSAAPALTPPPVTVNRPAAVGALSWSNLKVGSPEEAQVFRDLANGKISPKDIAK